MIDLDEAIQTTREAIQMVSDDDPDRAQWLNNLGSFLGDRFWRIKTTVDLEEAIEIGRQVLELTTEKHPDRAKYLDNLGSLLSDRYSRTGRMADLEEAVSYYQIALHQSSSPTFHRVIAGERILALYVTLSRWQQAYDDSSIAVHLIPRMTLRSLENSDRQHVLGQVVGLACDATALALQVGKPPPVGLNLLEVGRGAIATSLEEMQTDMSDLQKSYPELAEHFSSLRNELEQPNRRSVSSGNRSDESSLSFGKNRRYEAGKEFDELINEIRSRPDFSNFLLPPNGNEMQAAAIHGLSS